MSPIEFLACALLIALSAFLSSSEVALFSLSRFQLRSLKERFRVSHRRIKRLLADPGGLLITVLAGNEIINVSLSTIIAKVISRQWDRPASESALQGLHLKFFPGMPTWAFQMAIGIAATTPIILILCEITPKVIAARANQFVATVSAGPLTWIYGLFRPIRFLLNGVVRLLSGGKPEQEESHGKEGVLLREEEFLSMIEEGHKEGAIQETELELIRNVFELDDTSVKDVFTPVAQMQSIPAQTTIKNALTMMRANREKFSRIPVTGTSRKQVVGVLHTKDLLLSRLDPDAASEPISSIMMKPLIVRPDIRLSALFRKFKQSRTHMAVVQGPAGETLGVVTMRDVLDALFEDLLPDEEAAYAAEKSR